MKRRVFLSLILTVAIICCFGKHITGGWIHYEYQGFGAATDALLVKVYKIAPDILLPSAFTPNSDGKTKC